MQTHCNHVMWFWLYPFIVHIFNIHGSGVLIATWNCCHFGASSVYTIQPCLSLQCHKHAVFHTTRDSEVIVQLPEWQETTSPYHSGRKLTHHGIKEADSPWHLARKLTPCQLERKLIHCGIWKGSWLTMTIAWLGKERKLTHHSTREGQNTRTSMVSKVDKHMVIWPTGDSKKQTCQSQLTPSSCTKQPACQSQLTPSSCTKQPACQS